MIFKWIHGQEKNPIYEIARENNLVYEGFEKMLFENLSLNERNFKISKEQMNNQNFLESITFIIFTVPIIIDIQTFFKH